MPDFSCWQQRRRSFECAAPGACRTLIRDYREQCESDLEYLGAIESALRKAPAKHRDRPYWLMTLRHGRAIREAELRWCNETLAHLRTRRTPDRGAGAHDPLTRAMARSGRSSAERQTGQNIFVDLHSNLYVICTLLKFIFDSCFPEKTGF